MNHGAPRVVSVRDLPGATTTAGSGNRVPAWCALPLPGVTLVVSSENSRPRRIPIDNRRMYRVSGNGGDISVPELVDRTLVFFHHKNGSMRVSSPTDAGPVAVLKSVENGEVLLSSVPAEFDPNSDSIAVGDLMISVSQQSRHVAIRECLRAIDSEDTVTRWNTLSNRSAAEHSRGGNMLKSPETKGEKKISRLARTPPTGRTPASVRRKPKRQKEAGSSGVARAVRFLDI